jgi:hypothetical protein
VDLAFLTPGGRIIDVRTLKPIEGSSLEGAWVRDVVSTEKNQAGDGKEIVEKAVELMREIARRHPGKRAVPSVPWQASLSHALFVSAWDAKLAREGGPRDARRTLVVPAPLDPALEKVLEDPELLGKYERHTVFVQVDPKEAPAELKEALGRAGPGGIVLLDVARSVNGFGEKQDAQPRTYPGVLAVAAGPLTRSAVVELLGKHARPAAR